MNQTSSPPFNNRLCIILTNYGDDSLALIQWALETPLLHYQRQHQLLKVVAVDTGFSSASCLWQSRVNQVKQFIQNLKETDRHNSECNAGSAMFEFIELKSAISFQEAVINRGEFPSAKFQWCSTLLKGLPLLDWLDNIDPGCLAVIMSGKRRETLLPPFDTLQEWIEKSDYFNDRPLWHPIIEYNDLDRNHLLMRANFQPLGHPSLECSPCINSSEAVIANLENRDIQKIKILEEKLQAPFFPKTDNMDTAVTKAKKYLKISVKSQLESRRIYTHRISSCDKAPAKGSSGAYDLICEQRAEPATQSQLESRRVYQRYYRGCGNPYSCGI